mgnify:CR=1 FL=1
MTTLDDYTSTAARLDAENPLRTARDRFDLPEHESYFLGNSLGPLTHAARAAVLKTLDDEWRNGIVRTWHDGDWLDLAGATGDRVAAVVVGITAVAAHVHQAHIGQAITGKPGTKYKRPTWKPGMRLYGFSISEAPAGKQPICRRWTLSARSGS